MGVVSFTRAITATVTDNDWIICNCLSGEARFKWARRIENNIRYSEAIDNAAWTKSNLTVVEYSYRTKWNYDCWYAQIYNNSCYILWMYTAIYTHNSSMK